ncbi:MAG: hypothetical protein F9K40_05510 [Kofleriaceae bacterium]|nr:MAG: hypothetical protein F9K40_05510 [Kofleriaceae bacterium]MBZ0234624.1 hypothetical protein [Kofleriaceae bacterium]
MAKRWLWATAGAVALLVGLGTGCKDKDTKSGGQVVASASASASDEALIARRDALLKSRQSLKDQQAALVAERAKVIEAGGGTAEIEEIDKKVAELRTQEASLSSEESQILEQLMEERKTLLAAAQGGNDAAAQVAVREAGIAGREKAVAAREDRIAQREAEIAAREKALGIREKETCGAGAVPTTIIQTVDAKGSKYDKRDVEPLLKKARGVMGDRGILSSDLPGNVRELEKEATDAMKDADYGRAYLAANQLFKTVSVLPIDRNFIQAKSARISAAAKGKTLDGRAQKQVDELFADATSRFVDGDYKGANKKLNAIWSAIN